MKTATLVWVDPTARVNGVAETAADIAFIDVQMSADQGANFISLAHVVAGIQKFVQTELEVGTYIFKLLVNTTDGLVSAGVTGSATVAPPAVASNDVSGLAITLS
jgi:hypothetical protein